jgi:hypothetical protein
MVGFGIDLTCDNPSVRSIMAALCRYLRLEKSMVGQGFSETVPLEQRFRVVAKQLSVCVGCPHGSLSCGTGI